MLIGGVGECELVVCEFDFSGIPSYRWLSGIDHRKPDTVGAVTQVVKEHANSRRGTRPLRRRSQVVVGVTDGAIILDYRHHSHALGAIDEQVCIAPDRSQPTEKY